MHFLSNLRSYVASAVRVHGSALLSFLGATLAVGSFIASNLTDEPASTQWNILEGIGVLIAATGALISSVQQSRGAEKIQQKNIEIIDLQRQISDTLTGGLMPDTENIQSGQQYIYVMPPRQHALHDVRIHYADTSAALECGREDAEGLFRLVKEGASFNAM